MDNNNYPITKIDASLVPGSYGTGWQCFQFQIHNFLSLPQANIDQPLGPSIPFRCFGRNWIVDIFLGGRSDYLLGDVPVAILAHASGPSIDLDLKACDLSNKIVHSNIANQESYTRIAVGFGNTISSDLAKRQTILDNPSHFLDNGTYTITFCMKEKGSQNMPKTFIPKNPCSKSILSMLGPNGISTADVVFEVSSGLDGEPVRKSAHMFVLRS